MSNVAFFIHGIGSLKGGGGAERFFADFFDKYQKYSPKKFNLYYLIDKQSVINLKEVGKLNSKKKVLNFNIFSNRFKFLLETFELYYFVIVKGIKIIHIPLYNVSYIPLLKSINKMPGLFRPKLVINIVNCYVADALIDTSSKYHQSMKNTYIPLFSEVNIDGYFCWNENFKTYLDNTAKLKFLPTSTQSIISRFSDVENYYPAVDKKNWVVFASRLDEQKHPEWIVESILKIKLTRPALLDSWKFKVCGDGPLRQFLIDFCKKNNLLEYVDFVIEGEMYKILNLSKIYVSCQDFDNFPSLTMAEAMASGNAIIARNVGQTNLFVKNNENGLLLETDNVSGLEKALMQLMADEQLTSKMAFESIRSIKEVHNVQNFITQIESFWAKL